MNFRKFAIAAAGLTAAVLMYAVAASAQTWLQHEYDFSNQGQRLQMRAFGPEASRPHNHFLLPEPSDRFRLRLLNAGSKAGLKDTIRTLVIPTEYVDLFLFHLPDEFSDMLNKTGYSVNGAYGCAAEYLNSQTGSVFQFTVPSIARVSQERAYYGANNIAGNDIRPATLVAEACQLVDDEVDFSKFDNDGDGYVDNVCVIFAGEDEAQQASGWNSEFLWSHSHTLLNGDYGKVLELDGVKINSYSISSEMYLRSDGKEYISPIGTFCHEFCHSLGLVDMYDTDYELSGGKAAGVWGTTSIMSSGNYSDNGNCPPCLNAAELEMLGVMAPEEFQEGVYTMAPAGTDEARTYKISNPVDENEYFLFECRAKSGWDKYVGGSGMLVYHIDKNASRMTASELYMKDLSSKERWSPYNEVNCRPDHQCADLIEADCRVDKDPDEASQADISGVFFPRYEATTLGGNGKIPLMFWDSTYAALALTNITQNGDNVAFKVINAVSPIPPDPTEPPVEGAMLYIVIIHLEDGSLNMKVNNSYGAQQVKWSFDGAPIADPGSFRPAGSGLLKAEIIWDSTRSDVITRYIRK